jgi:hypothetical protein
MKALLFLATLVLCVSFAQAGTTRQAAPVVRPAQPPPQVKVAPKATTNSTTTTPKRETTTVQPNSAAPSGIGR